VIPQVLEFRPAEGSERGRPSVQQVTATPESLGLAPRDMSLFAADSGPGVRRCNVPRVESIALHLHLPAVCLSSLSSHVHPLASCTSLIDTPCLHR
jgi:hypothetical protein